MLDTKIQEYTRGKIYMADLGNTTGSEQGGKRPVVIIQNDVGNRFSPTVVVASLTSKQTKRHIPTHVKLEKDDYDNLFTDSIVLAEQVRTIDKSKLLFEIDKVNDDDMKNIEKAILVSLGFVMNYRMSNNRNNDLQFA